MSRKGIRTPPGKGLHWYVTAGLRRGMTTVRPFTVDEATRDYGTSLEYLRPLADHWRDGYAWRPEEAKVNGFSRFRATVDGPGVHFVHERGPGARLAGPASWPAADGNRSGQRAGNSELIAERGVTVEHGRGGADRSPERESRTGLVP